MAIINREHWLAHLLDLLSPYVTTCGLTVPVKGIHATCGFPFTSPRKRIGECWAASCSADGVHQIFISPLKSDPTEVAEILIHELLHACLPAKEQHGRLFKRAMKAVGLEGKATATQAGTELKNRLTTMVSTLTPYPHPALSIEEKKKQTTRMKKVICPTHLDYTWRASRKVMAMGMPLCGMKDCHCQMEETLDTNDDS
jgi:hypothetical protein